MSVATAPPARLFVTAKGYLANKNFCLFVNGALSVILPVPLSISQRDRVAAGMRHAIGKRDGLSAAQEAELTLCGEPVQPVAKLEAVRFGYLLLVNVQATCVLSVVMQLVSRGGSGGRAKCGAMYHFLGKPTLTPTSMPRD